MLTTNQEPGLDIVRDVSAAALRASISVDIWSRSRLAHFLDNTAKGQWLRLHYLDIAAEILSQDLLQELSKDSLATRAPPDPPEAWVARGLDGALAAAAQKGTTFLVAPSGLGKSIAGYRWLLDHIAQGGVGLVLPHEAIGGTITIADAIGFVLRQLCPSLGRSAGEDALALTSAEHPLYLMVEDINRSDQAVLLAERIEGWARIDAGNSQNFKRHYRLVCPLWPEVLASMGERTRKAVSALAVFGSSFAAIEGRQAVQKRAMLGGRPVSDMAADAVSSALGHDPLLIALHDPSKVVASGQVIGDFVENVVGRVAVSQRDYTATDYRVSLRAFSGASLRHRMLNPLWRDVRCWSGIDSEDLRRLSNLMHEGSLLHLSGQSLEQRVGYRHDRVRDWLLIDAADGLAAEGTLPNAIVQEPYFAELLGGLVVRSEAGAGLVERMRVENPLALFHALRLLSNHASHIYEQVVTAIDEWLSDPSTHEASNQYLRWEALAVLAQTDGPDVIRLVSLFRERNSNAWKARLRNGDVSGGIELCVAVEPGSGAPWRDIQIEHAKHKFGRRFVLKIAEILRLRDIPPQTRRGSLRLAGHVADPKLGDAIATCWALDSNRELHLADYLWACAECCGTDAQQYLQPVCDAWARLPRSENDGNAPSTRERLAANHVRWAFRKWIPTDAIPYFVKRAENDDLRWPITYMLSEIDDPIAVRFVIQQIAEIESTNSYSPFASTLAMDLRRRQQHDGIGMSEASRRPLQILWTDPGTDKHVRRAAFKLWAATHRTYDLALLHDPALPADLADSVLQQRLLRSDHSAIPALIEKIGESGNYWWWCMMKYVWSDNLISILDAELERRGKHTAPEFNKDNHADDATSELLMQLPPEIGEKLLIKHWEKLQHISHFVQAALYLATPNLREMAGRTIDACPDPKNLLQYILQHIGLNEEGRPGITREAQVVALSPYLGYFSPHEVMGLWEACNKRGWFSLRRSILDPHLRAINGIVFEDEAPTFAALDDMVATERVLWIDVWLERYARTGATSDMIIKRIGKWFELRRTVSALILVHRVLVNIGRRSDLGILNVTLDAPDPRADQIRADTAFAVKRRSLH